MMNQQAETIRSIMETAREVLALLQNENRQLRSDPESPFSEAHLESKRELLEQLGERLDAVREAGQRSGGRMTSFEGRELLPEARQLVMKAMLLDRENEQLMLRARSGAKAASADAGRVSRVAKSQVAKTYGGRFA